MKVTELLRRNDFCYVKKLLYIHIFVGSQFKLNNNNRIPALSISLQTIMSLNQPELRVHKHCP